MMNRRNFLSSLALLTVTTKLQALDRLKTESRSIRPLKLMPKRVGQYRIMFGSCNKPEKGQAHFDLLQKLDPDLFLWLGDCVYADTKDKNKLVATFKVLKENSHYAKFAKSVEVEGVWDDHDYGWNNSGSEYELKEFSQQNYLNFLGTQKSDPRWNRKGIYHSLDRGGAKIIMFDCRYHKTEQDMLGEEQWQFVEKQLREAHLNKVPLTILASSITVIGPEYRGSEGWHNTPYSRDRLFSLLQTYPQNKVVFISGDKHFSAFMERTMLQTRYTEFMASGMTHNTPFFLKPSMKTKYGADNCQFENNFGIIDLDFNNDQAQLYSMMMNGKVAISRTIKL
jgi:alkaline phosphatase D